MRAIWYALLTAVIGGIANYVNKFLITSFDAFQFATLKNILVACAMIPIIMLMREHRQILKPSKKGITLLALIGLVGGSIPFLLFFYGLKFTAAANAAFIHKNIFVFATLFAFIILREKVSKRQLLDQFVLFIGVALLFNLTGVVFNVYDVLILVATVFWGIEQVISKVALRSMSPRAVSFGRMAFGSIFMLAFLAATGNISFAVSLSNIIALAVSSSMLLFYTLVWYAALRDLSVASATSILLFGSVVTSMLQLNISAINILGIALICLPVALIAMRERAAGA